MWCSRLFKARGPRGHHRFGAQRRHPALRGPQGRGVTYTVAKVSPGDNDATVNAFRQAIGPKTRLAVCTMASNVFGIRVPVERIAALCHQYDVALCVDAAQGAGLFPIHMGESGIDYLCCAGHKGLYGPMGTGLLLVREPERLLGTLVEGGTGTQSRSFQMPQEAPERYESGTVNVPGILGLGAGLEFVRRRGVERICQEELQKLRYLHGRLSRLGKVTLYTPAPGGALLGAGALLQPGGRPQRAGWGEFLAQGGIAVRCGLHCAPLAHEKLGTLETGTVRVSPSAFTRKEDLDALAARLSRWRE